MATQDEAYEAALKYIRAQLDTHGETRFAETDYDELGPLYEYVWDVFSDYKDRAILHVVQGMAREFGTGFRCMVCGRTKAQNASLGYNCFEEC